MDETVVGQVLKFVDVAAALVLGGIYWQFRRLVKDVDCLDEELHEHLGDYAAHKQEWIEWRAKWNERYTNWLARGR